MPRAAKGSDFERTVCKQLSLWWSGGSRDDIYWRSSQSGGRATQRSKKGKTTYGSYGDIASVDPIGEPLLKMFTIELKRGSSYSSPGDLVDFKTSNSSHPWVKCYLQAKRSHEQAKTHSWMMVCKRDHRQPLVYLDAFHAKILSGACEQRLNSAPFFQFRFEIRNGDNFVDRVNIVGIPLDVFLTRVKPCEIIECLKKL